ncbi:MAG: hypothetical protein ACI92O_001232 [Colwellia sp.]
MIKVNDHLDTLLALFKPVITFCGVIKNIKGNLSQNLRYVYGVGLSSK